MFSFYVKNYNNFKNPNIFLNFIRTEYELLKIKKSKLKLGSIVFQLVEVKHQGVLLNRYFELVFINQAGPQLKKKKLQKWVDFLKWNWDFTNICALSIIISFLFDIFSKNLKLFLSFYFEDRFKLFNIIFLEEILNSLIPLPTNKITRGVCLDMMWTNNIVIDFCKLFEFFI